MGSFPIFFCMGYFDIDNKHIYVGIHVRIYKSLDFISGIKFLMQPLLKKIDIFLQSNYAK